MDKARTKFVTQMRFELISHYPIFTKFSDITDIQANKESVRKFKSISNLIVLKVVARCTTGPRRTDNNASR